MMDFLSIKKMWISIGIFLVLFTSNLHSEEMRGKIVKIVDGDTVHFLPIHSKKKIRIRLKSIDSPEKKQPFGKKRSNI